MKIFERLFRNFQNSVARSFGQFSSAHMKDTDFKIVMEEIPDKPTALQRRSWEILSERLLETEIDEEALDDTVEGGKSVKPPLGSLEAKIILDLVSKSFRRVRVSGIIIIHHRIIITYIEQPHLWCCIDKTACISRHVSSMTNRFDSITKSTRYGISQWALL